MSRGVVIVAADACTALAPDLDGTLRGLLEGRRAVAPLRGFPPEEAAGLLAAQVDPPASTAPPAAAPVATRHGAYLEHLARSVHGAARGADLPREEVGLHVGLGIADSEPEALAAAVAASRDASGAFDLACFFAGGFRAVHPHWPLRMLNNVPVGQVAAALDLRGDNTVAAPEADAGVRAVAEAVAAIRAGAVRASVAAGVGEDASPVSSLRASFRGTPGLVLGEGGGALFLEDERSAALRGRPALGRVLGIGFAFGARPGGPGATSDARARAARAALAEAGVAPDAVACALVDGSGGAAEGDALRAVLGARAAGVAVVDPSPSIGHLLAGAPVVAAALATAILAAGAAPPAASGAPPRPVPRGSVALVLASSTRGSAAALVVGGAA